MAKRKNRRNRSTLGRTHAPKTDSAPSAGTLGLLMATAQEEQDPRIALEVYQAIAEASRHAAAPVLQGKARRTGDTGDARLYLDAMFGTGVSLRRLDRREEAINYFREVLRWDAKDRPFARYWLAGALFDLDRHDELQDLLERHDEPTAIWRYAQALLAFRLHRDTDEARRLLQGASQLGPEFLDYLLGDGLVDASRPVRFGGARQETAHSAAALFLPAWRSTAGAASWARRVLRVPLRDRSAELPAPSPELQRLPRRNVTWQLGLRRLDGAARGEAAIWILGIANLDDQKMMCMTVVEEAATPEAVLREVLRALRQPMEGPPHRPARLEVPRKDFCRAWQPMLTPISVECVFEEDPQPIGLMLGHMAEHVAAQRLPSLPQDFDPREFPQTDQVWQADFFRVPTIISNEEVGLEQPWAVIVADKGSGFIMSNEFIRGEPTPEQLWEHVLRTMGHPGPCEPMRPSKVELSDSDSHDLLKPKLEEIGVGCVLRDELPELHEFCQVLASSFGGPENCALADGRGVTTEQMESFYHSAAEYFKKAPWRHVPGEIPIEVRCKGLHAPTRYAIVLGRTGVTLGLAVYEGWDEVLAMLHGMRTADEMLGFSIFFDEVAVMAPGDLHLVQRSGWPVATPEAYPVALRLEPGREPHPPSSEDLDYIESCLRAVPDFVICGQEAKTYEMTVNGRPLKMRLSWTVPRR